MITVAVETWNPLIRKKASQVYRKYHGSVEYEDCLQQGYEIFCKALHSFDPDKGAAFGTWLHWQLKSLQKDMSKSQLIPGDSTALEFLVKPSETWEYTVYLSEDAQFLLKLLLERRLHRQSSGPGRVVPGGKTVWKHMGTHYKWSKDHSIDVFLEIKMWWRTRKSCMM